jgi:hypothetical protein
VGGGLLGPPDGPVLGFLLVLLLGLAEPLLLVLGLAEPLRDALGLAEPLRLVLGLADALRDALGLAEPLRLALGLGEPLRLGLVLGLAEPLRDGLADELPDGLCEALRDGEALPLGHGDEAGDPDGPADALVADRDGDGVHAAASWARSWRIRCTVFSTSAGSGCPGATHGSSMNSVPSIRRSHG